MDQRSTFIEKLQKIIDYSELPPDDKIILLKALPFTPDEHLALFLRTCTEAPASIYSVIKIVKLRLEIIQNPDKTQQLIDWERGEINNALSNGTQ